MLNIVFVINKWEMNVNGRYLFLMHEKEFDVKL